MGALAAAAAPSCPCLTSLLAYPLLHGQPGRGSLVGGPLIVVGLVLTTRGAAPAPDAADATKQQQRPLAVPLLDEA